jgi:Cu/Ag efflux protein CusF
MRSLAMSLTVSILLVFSLTAFAQQPPAAPPAGGGAPQAPAAEKTYAGTLAKVDLAAKEIIVKGTDNKEMVFTFTDKTQMSGVENPQGLNGKTGANLKVTYREGPGNPASKIEVAGGK